MEAIYTLGMPSTAEMNEGCYLKQDLIERLSKIRMQPVKKDAFRRWRKKADIPDRVRGRYSLNHCLRLTAIASHLANGGFLSDDELDLQLLEIIEGDFCHEDS